VNNETATEGPALAELADVLHLVFPDKVSGNLVHLQFNDTTATWGQRLVLNFTTSGPPALTVFNGSLVLAYMNSTAKNQLHVAQWDPANGWSPPYDLGGAPLSWGTPALYTLGSQIYILFPANNSGRKVLAMTATQVNGTWNPTAAPNESTAFGTSAATYEITAIMAFQSNNGKGQLFASIFNGFSWASHEDTGQTTSHTPAVTVLDGIANCIFSSHNSSSTVLWVQRQISLSPLRAWMAPLDGTLLLSEMSIPGTHDSASVTTFPFTATQELSIFEQLLMGVRFLDLRCTLVDNVLQMYHASISLDTTLELMLAQIYTFLSSSTQEAVIVSIKQESDPIDSNVTFDAALSQLIGQEHQSWNLSTTIPQLQDIRGKIQLVRRYKAGSIGIDASNWPNNVPTFTAPLPNGALVVEDFYNFDFVVGLDSIISNKMSLLLGALTAAQTDPINTNWYLSFSSASNTPFNMPEDLAVGATALVPLPPHFVVGINQRLASDLFSRLGSAPKVGTVLMDFVDTPGGGALVEAIVSFNGL
jgi:1-phosphatidylinositol phosphodiesterase